MSESSEGPRLGRVRFEEDAQAGLTLVELLIVLLVVGVLLAIVLPPRLSTARPVHKAAYANLLYTNGRESHTGVCGGTAVPTVTAIDESLDLSSGAPPRKVRTIPTTVGNNAGGPATAECRRPGDSTLRTGADLAGKADSPAGTCRRAAERTGAHACTAGSTPVGADYPSARST